MSRRGNPEGRRVKLRCAYCGKAFWHVVTAGGRYPEYCSRTCKNNAIYRRRGRKGY